MSEITKPETGYCQCGCGQTTQIAKKTRAVIGHKKGRPIPYVNGHNRRKALRWLEEDRGYETPCWIWQLAKSIWGYGLAHTPDGQEAAHRLVYKESGKDIPDGKQLDHLCRQRDCVKPDHLEPKTGAENVQCGERAILNSGDVQIIRKLLKSKKMTHKEIASMYDVARPTISQIARGHTWKNVP